MSNRKIDYGQRTKPLYEVLRPSKIEEVVGQNAVIGTESIIGKALKRGLLPSIIFWGPPGTGKTTIAKLVAIKVKAELISISAVMSGIKDIRSAINKALEIRRSGGKVIIFVDEVHRFNKVQQDAFLPHLEVGDFVFFGATTENPGFEINSALSSRTQIIPLSRLCNKSLEALAERALTYMSLEKKIFTKDAFQTIISNADGDGRKLLILLENSLNLVTRDIKQITIEMLTSSLPTVIRAFNKRGDAFYDQISALHKSIRGSDADASLYWFLRMIDGGADLKYLARRLIRVAIEDIGLADPRALRIALDAAEAFERLGSPEGELALAEATIFLAVSAKSNSVYTAFKRGKEFIAKNGSESVPYHLRNAVTRFEKELDYGKDYHYSHDSVDKHSLLQTYFPEKFASSPPNFYYPNAQGLEIKILEKLNSLKAKKTKSINQNKSGTR